MARQKMSNKDIQEFLNDAYNKWFCKWRDNLHSPTDYNKFGKEGIALIEKYMKFEDADFEPCTTIIQQFVKILDDRKGT